MRRTLGVVIGAVAAWAGCSAAAQRGGADAPSVHFDAAAGVTIDASIDGLIDASPSGFDGPAVHSDAAPPSIDARSDHSSIDGALVRDAAAASDAVIGADAPLDSTPRPDATAAVDAGSAVLPGLRAFPEAEGFGAAATGGRGGRVLFVTNLNASGPGSLQAALDAAGPRYILFRVSGFIDAYVTLGASDATIAGQTAPGGITLRGFITDEDGLVHTHVNWILRHVRLRPRGDGDGLRMRYTKNAIVDHVSIGHADDEAIEISYSNHVTVQNTLLAESLGDHPYNGILINYADPDHGFDLSQISLVHNTWNRIIERIPEVSRESPAQAGSTIELEVSNNLMWDVARPATIASTQGQTGEAAVYMRLNWVANAFFVRASYPYGMIEMGNLNGMPAILDAHNTSYLSDNQMNLYPERHDYRLIYCCNDYAESSAAQTPTPAHALTARLPFGDVIYLPSATLRAHMLQNVGAFPRDAMDRRLMHPIATGQIDMTPQNQLPGGVDDAYSSEPAPALPADSDDDGMPDDWELAHGLNPHADDHLGTVLSNDGYPNLEVYLNELANRRINGP